MDRYAVVGNPVAHSLSPRIHAEFARATGERLRYDKLPAPLEGFAETVTGFFAAGGRGLNVTVPFKEQAARWVDELDAAAAAAQAVNTIVALPGPAGTVRYRGYNTDGAGLVRDLIGNCGETLADASVLLLGAGGAARGVARPLLAEGPRRLVISNRTPGRADALAASLTAGSAGVASIAALGPESLDEAFDVVVNATSAGLSGSDRPRVAVAAVAGACCYDLVYGAAGATPFCRWAAEHDARRVVDGLGMLVEQAALAFELWRGVAPETAPVLELLRREGV